MKIKLPAPNYRSDTSLEETLYWRRSIREYKNDPLTLQEIGQLLWAAQGVTSKNGLRTAPSAGALYPLEIYLVSGHINNLEPGVYHYMPLNHSLEKMEEGDQRNKLVNACFNQNVVQQGVALIVIAANYTKTIMKYSERGYRYVHMEAGHAAENIYLQAVSLGLGTVAMGAFNDEEVKKILHFKNLAPLYIMPVGRNRA